jgi:hypothetical protein
VWWQNPQYWSAESVLKQEQDGRIGGADDLPERVAAALAACYRELGDPLTAKRYKVWRDGLPVGEQRSAPSLTAVVPIAFPSWSDARAAAGIPVGESRDGAHGPRPRWSQDDCLALLREWLDAGGSGTLAAFSDWLDEQRDGGRDVPSPSTIRLRMRMPWASIREAARSMADGG